jgi:hypothetical protein
MFEYLRAVKTPSTEDFRLMLELFKQSESSPPSAITICSQDYASIPNCRFPKFRSLKSLPDLETLMEFLSSFPLVINSYIFFDAVYCWIFDQSEISIGETDIITFVGKFMGIIRERAWRPLVPEYLAGKTGTLRNKTARGLKRVMNRIETNAASKSYNSYSRILSVDDYSPEEFFGQDNDVKFYFEHPNTVKCQEAEKCGFILRVTGMFGNVDDTFDIQVVIDPEYYQGDIYFHNECINVANMHVALQIDKYAFLDFPISWSGRPSRDNSDRYYMWGQHKFVKKEEEILPKGDDNSYSWFF